MGQSENLYDAERGPQEPDFSGLLVPGHLFWRAFFIFIRARRFLSLTRKDRMRFMDAAHSFIELVFRSPV